MGRQVNCLDLLGLVSQHEVGSLALETAISIEVTACYSIASYSITRYNIERQRGKSIALEVQVD